MDDSADTFKQFKSKFSYGAKVITFLLIILALLYAAPNVLFLLFGGILFSIFLSSIADFLAQKLNIKYSIGLTITVLTIIAITVASYFYLAPSLADQFDKLVKKVPEAVSGIISQLSHYSWFQYIMDEAKSSSLMPESSRIFKNVKIAFTGVLGLIANFVIILFIGLYCAAEPQIYKNGLLHLVPKARRMRYKEVIDQVADTLRWWLIGKFFGMAVIGILTLIGLMILDIPLALALAIIAALFTFIPNFGPIISAVPAILLGFVISPQKALYVTLMYLGIQTVESYLLTPLVQRKVISLPPALILAGQVLLGVTVGGIGVAIATPLLAAILVATKMLYVQDTLNDPVEV